MKKQVLLSSFFTKKRDGSGVTAEPSTSEEKKRSHTDTTTESSDLSTKAKNKKYDLEKRQRCFLPQWSRDYPWVKYDPDNNYMLCTVCQRFPVLARESKSTFLTGCKSFRLQTITAHDTSDTHVKCLQAGQALDHPQERPMIRILRNINENVREKLEKLMRTAYYIALYEMPFSKFPSLCELQSLNGVILGNTYLNDHACKHFIESIAAVMKDDLKMDLNGVDVLSFMCDGSTDSGIIEEELVYVKYLKAGKQVTTFLSIQAPEHSNATGVKKAIEDAFEYVGVEDWKMKTTSAGTDGASVNTGRVGGLIALLSQDIVWLKGIWCVAHQLELGVLDSIKHEQFLSDIKELLQGIYKQYHYSPKAIRELKEVAEALESKMLRPVNILGTRWAPHMYRSLEILLQNNYTSLCTHFSHTAEGRDASVTMVGRCRKVLRQLSDFNFLLKMHLMLDILGQTSILSLKFQKDECTLSSANDGLMAFCLTIAQMKNENGENVSRFLNEVGEGNIWKNIELQRNNQAGDFHRFRSRVCESVLNYVSNRFQTIDRDPVLKASKVFDPKEWPDQNALAQFGNQEIIDFSTHYAGLLARQNYDGNVVRQEWLEFKVFGARHHHGRDFLEFWEFVLINHSNRFPQVCKLAQIALTFPLNTACCERGFSIMKKIKTDWRSKLTPKTLDCLMRITIAGLPINIFDPARAIEHFLTAGERQRRPEYMDN